MVMGNLDELEITTEENATDGLWHATATAYPDFDGEGLTEEDAKADLKSKIQEANPEGSESGESESTEG